MKKLFIAFIAAFLFTACNNKKEQGDKGTEIRADSTGNKTASEVRDEPATGTSIVGKWKPVAMDLAGMSEEDKKDMKENIMLEFSENGIFTGYNKDKKQEGTYVFDSKQMKLDVINSADSKDTEHFTIGWEDGLLLMTNKEGTVKLRKEN